MTLVAFNCYPERIDGDVCVWLVFSQIDGQIFHASFDIASVDQIIEALTSAAEQAREMESPPSADEIRMCALCGERPGVSIYGWHCQYCWEARRREREEW